VCGRDGRSFSKGGKGLGGGGAKRLNRDRVVHGRGRKNAKKGGGGGWRKLVSKRSSERSNSVCDTIEGKKKKRGGLPLAKREGENPSANNPGEDR